MTVTWILIFTLIALTFCPIIWELTKQIQESIKRELLLRRMNLINMGWNDAFIKIQYHLQDMHDKKNSLTICKHDRFVCDNCINTIRTEITALRNKVKPEYLE